MVYYTSEDLLYYTYDVSLQQKPSMFSKKFMREFAEMLVMALSP